MPRFYRLIPHSKFWLIPDFCCYIMFIRNLPIFVGQLLKNHKLIARLAAMGDVAAQGQVAAGCH